MKINITKHPTKAGWYYIEFRPNGAQGKRERIPIEGYASAQVEKERLDKLYHGKSTRTLSPRIKDIYEEYLGWVKLNQAPATHATKDRAFKQIIPHFGNYRVSELTQTVYDEFHKKLPRKRRAIIMYQHYLSAMIRWAVERDMCKPLEFKPHQPKYKAGKPVIPSMADIQAVIDSQTDPSKKTLLEVMLWTGLRWNEARLLRWEDVYLAQRVMRVRESDEEEEVHIPIYPDFYSWMKANKKASGWVFPNPRTKAKEPWTTFKTFLRNTSEKLGVHISHHDFRRRSGQNVYEASGYDVFAAQRHLRHREIRTTMRYLGIDDQRRSQIMTGVIEHVARLRKEGGQLDKPKKRTKKANLAS